MPRGFMTAAQRAAAQDRAADEDLRRRIRLTVAALGLTGETFAARIGISYPTLARRMRSPGTFTLAELRRFERLEENAGTNGGERIAV